MAITKIQSESLNLADDFAFTGTITGAGEANTPAFRAYANSSSNLVGDTWSVIPCDTENFDTDNAYNTSSYRFTVPSGKAGKYFLNGQYKNNYTGDRSVNIYIVKNGTDTLASMNGFRDNGNGLSIYYPKVSVIVNLSEGDYVDLRQGISYFSVSGQVTAGENSTFFEGFKIST